MIEDEQKRKREQLFLSYSREDSVFAFRLRDDLVKRGFNVWMDQVDIPGGHHWDETIEEALSESRVLLVLSTPASIKSQNVRDEVDYAIDEGIDILPLLYKEVKFPLRWRRYQYVVINEKNYTQAFPEVVNSVLRCLGKKVEVLPLPTVWQKYKKIIFGLLLLAIGLSMILVIQKFQHQIASLFHKEKVVSTLPMDKPMPQTKEKISHIKNREENKPAFIKTNEINDISIKKTVLETKTEPVHHKVSVHKLEVETTKPQMIKKTPASSKKEPLPKVIQTSNQKSTVQKYDLSRFNNTPYEGASVVREFVDALNHDKKVMLKITNYTNKDDAEAMDKLIEVRDWLMDRGIQRSDIEIEISKERLYGFTYEIERK